jgi:hypothetical protein
MQEDAEKYGVDLQSLGDRFQPAKLTEEAGAIAAAFQRLTDGGADVGAAVAGMADEAQKLVDRAAETGAKLPDTMRPLIQHLIDSGRLLDENGERFTHIGQINFADPIVDSTQRIVDKLQELIDTLTGKLPQAAGVAVSGIENQFRGVRVNIPVGFDVPKMPEFGQVEEFARGTARVLPFARRAIHAARGLDTVPAMLTPGEAVLTTQAADTVGRPTIAHLNAGGALPSAGGGSVTIGNINIHAQGNFADTPAARRELARMVGEEVMRQQRIVQRLNAA